MTAFEKVALSAAILLGAVRWLTAVIRDRQAKPNLGRIFEASIGGAGLCAVPFIAIKAYEIQGLILDERIALIFGAFGILWLAFDHLGKSFRRPAQDRPESD